MTVLLAWIDEFGGWLISDSAASHEGPPRHASTSFGELQLVDQGTVEEAAIKISHLARGTLAAVCGSARDAERFLIIVDTTLTTSNKDLWTILSDLTIVSQEWEPFAILFMQSPASGHILTLFDSARGPKAGTTGERETCIAGSLSANLYWQVSAGITSIRALPASPETKQVLAVAYMQSLGIANILSTQGVGGTFWSARLTQGVCHWQNDIIYIIYSPGACRPAPRENSFPELNLLSSVDVVRCLIRREIGFTVSSIRRALSALVPLGCTQAALNLAQREIEHPRRYLVASRYVAFLSRTGRRIILIDRETTLQYCDFAFVYENDIIGKDTTEDSPPSKVIMVVSDKLKTFLETPAAQHDACFITVLRHTGTQVEPLEFHLPYADESFGYIAWQ